ncbi:MAG: hypothetical protein JOZ39_02990 [Chloroflexi bacterium]|nr:hypothetical protein [Chloroflexota bacterium]
MAGKETRLLVGVGAGLFEITGNGSWNARPIGLMGTGGIRGLVVDSKDPARMYAATGQAGVQRSRDGGRTWEEANEGILYLEGYSICQQPTTGDIYFGTQPASVFKSSDGGDTWTDCTKLRDMPETLFWTFPRAPHIAHVKDIQVSSVDPNLVYGAIEEGWLIHSWDGGENWVTLKQGVEFDSHAVTLLPDDIDTVLATSGIGVYRSEDRGKTFARSDEGIHGHLGGGYMSPAVVHEKRPKTLFAGAAEVPPPWWMTRKEGANSHFFRSDDQGRKWSQLDHGGEIITGGPRGIAIDPENPERVFFGTMNGTLWMTEDGEKVTKVMEGLKGPVGAIRVVPQG